MSNISIKTVTLNDENFKDDENRTLIIEGVEGSLCYDKINNIQKEDSEEDTIQKEDTLHKHDLAEKFLEHISEKKHLEIPIYIVHYHKLESRKEYLSSKLNNIQTLNIKQIWCSDIDRDNLTKEHLDRYQYSYDKWYELNAIWSEYSSKPRILSNSEIACNNTHFLIYKDIIDNNIQDALILEDDSIILDNFENNIIRILKDLKKNDYDICYVNKYDHIQIKMEDDKISLEEYLTNENNLSIFPIKKSKCTISYLLSNNGARIFYKNLIPFCLPIDWMHTPIMIQHNMKSYWSLIDLVSQGSESIYKSSIERETKEHKIKEQTIILPLLDVIKNYRNFKKVPSPDYEGERVYNVSSLISSFQVNNQIIPLVKYDGYDICVTINNENAYICRYRNDNEIIDDYSKYSEKRLDEFIGRIKSGDNFIIAKYGDGEYTCMISDNENLTNCDSCNYYNDMGNELIQSYIYFLQKDNAYITRWPSNFEIRTIIEKDYSQTFNKERKFIYSEILLHRLYKVNQFYPGTIQFFRAIRSSDRLKIYVSNNAMIKAVAPLLNLNLGFEIPDVNSYQLKNQIINQLTQLISQQKTKGHSNIIILFSAGMFSEIIMMDLSMKFNDITMIDIGSSFDGLIRPSRYWNSIPGYASFLAEHYKN